MKSFVFKPEAQRVLVLPDEKREEKTKTGIILPSATKEDKPFFGEVIAVGKGDSDRPMVYKPGERVLFSSYAGIEVPLNIKGKGYFEYRVMNQIDIMGIIEEVKDENLQ